MRLYTVEPGFNGNLQVMGRTFTNSFDIKYRGEITGNKLNRTDKEISLLMGICFGRKEMVSPTDKTITMCLIKIERESIVSMVTTLSGFHKDKMDRKFGCFIRCQLYPIYTTLIMGDINAMHFIVTGHTDTISFLTITRLPAISIRANEKPIKPDRKHSNNPNCKYSTQPCGHDTFFALFLTAACSRYSRTGSWFSTRCRISFSCHALVKIERKSHKLRK